MHHLIKRDVLIDVEIYLYEVKDSIPNHTAP